MESKETVPAQSPKAEPVQYPTITIGGINFEVKFTCLVLMNLEECGLKFEEPNPDYDPECKDPEDPKSSPTRGKKKWTLREIFTGLAAIVSTAAKPYTADQVAELIPADQAASAFTLFAQAMGKVTRPVSSAPATVAQTPPVDSSVQ